MKLFDYINQGGVIMYLLVLINIFGIALMLYKFFDLTNSLKNLEQTAVYISSKIKDAFSTNNDTPTQAKVEISLRELNSYMSGQEKGLNTIKVIATVSPLLGLLGTRSCTTRTRRIVCMDYPKRVQDNSTTDFRSARKWINSCFRPVVATEISCFS